MNHFPNKMVAPICAIFRPLIAGSTTPEQIALDSPRAGIGSRFLTLAIDTLLQFVLNLVGGLAIAFLLAAVGAGLFRRVPASLAPALMLLFLFCVYWGYFTFFEIIGKGQTPGKRYAGIHVIKESGRPINAFEAISRNLMRAVAPLPGMYGVGVVLFFVVAQIGARVRFNAHSNHPPRGLLVWQA